MTNSTLPISAEFVRAGMERSGVMLTHNLEAYLAFAFDRFMDSKIQVDLLTVRIIKAMDTNAPKDILRNLADETLIACAFFEPRLRQNGSVRHYVGLGQVTYDAAGLTEQAYGFILMRDVIMCGVSTIDVKRLLDDARAGSSVAKQTLASENVVVGPWGKQKWL